MKLKKVYQLLSFILVSNFVIAQDDFNNFSGDMLFKETYFHYPISRKNCDTVICYWDMKIDSSISLKRASIMDETHVEFLDFKFIESNDSIFMNYTHPTNNRLVKEYFFPLNKNDTCFSSEDYKLELMLVYVNDSSYTTYYNEIYNETIYLGDT